MSYFDNLNPNQWLHAIGLQRETESAYLMDTLVPALAIFSAGMVVGATVAVLVTPKSGRELRNDLSRKATELTDSVRSQMPRLRNDQQQSYSTTGVNPDL